MEILTVDPGPTPGWAIFDSSTVSLLECGQGEQFCWLEPMSRYFDLRIIVYERYFVSRPMQGLEASEVIGALRLKSRQTGLKLVQQEPSVPNFIDKKYFSSKHRVLKIHGLHAADAVRHGLYFLGVTLGKDIRSLVERVSISFGS